jgi:hypothetical protein
VGCKEPTDMAKDDFPLTGWPHDVLDELVEVIQQILERKDISDFYIGRTTDLNASRNRHGADVIQPLYETDSTEHAMQVENALIEEFFEFAKCSNDAPDSRGGISEEEGGFVYVALWHSDDS